MNRLEISESVEGNRELFEGLDRVLVPEDQPKVPTEVKELRRVVKQKLLVPVRVPRPLYHHTHDSVILIRLSVLIERPSKF